MKVQHPILVGIVTGFLIVKEMCKNILNQFMRGKKITNANIVATVFQ